MKLLSPKDPILYTICKPVENIGRDVMPYFKKMRAVMRKNRGVGLSANQVGLTSRFFVTSLRNKRVVINPLVLRVSEEMETKLEGCLSFNHKAFEKERHVWLEVSWKTEKGHSRKSILRGLEARVFQHEIDHLNGICLFDSDGNEIK